MKLDKEWHNFFREIVRKDVYQFKRFGFDAFDSILDVGGNVGVFSTFARLLNPSASVIALEPCKATAETLRGNTRLLGVTVEPCALGSGEQLRLGDTGYSGSTYFSSSANGYEVESIPLSTLIQKHGIKDRYFLKIDCEGGEWSILSDKKSNEIFANAKGIGIEIHFSHDRCTLEANKNLPKWEVFHEWINQFNNTHEINYGHSNRKYGAGIYTLKRKD